MKCQPVVLIAVALSLHSWQKKDNQSSTTNAKINFIFKFDSTQARLNAIGQPSIIVAGNAAQSPRFNKMSAHYLELAPNALTAVGAVVSLSTKKVLNGKIWMAMAGLIH